MAHNGPHITTKEEKKLYATVRIWNATFRSQKFLTIFHGIEAHVNRAEKCMCLIKKCAHCIEFTFSENAQTAIYYRNVLHVHVRKKQ
jgi:hypothetical protein